jgi:hypothetical protein
LARRMRAIIGDFQLLLDEAAERGGALIT